jgi:hypothetical protein
MRGHLLVVAAFGTALMSALACGTDPVGVETCRKIERARCENAPACGVDLSQPTHRGDSPELSVAACIRFYDDACLHGLAAPTDPGNVQTQACIDAINTDDCSVVKTPESHPSCVFLVPPEPAPAVVLPVDAAIE